MNWRQSEEVTRGLILSLGQAPSPEALTASVEALNEHLICYPSHKALMWQVCCKGNKGISDKFPDLNLSKMLFVSRGKL